jgi:L-lactate dehydrogenase complex protein LldG
MSQQSIVGRFIDELERVAGKAQRAESGERAFAILVELLQAHQAHTVALSDFALARELNLANALREAGCELVTGREIARADVGISGADLAVAETGSLLIGSESGYELVTALPPVHIALIRTDQIVATLEEAFAFCQRELDRASKNFLFVTGPSRTADIELTPVIGVHGPQELSVIVIS